MLKGSASRRKRIGGALSVVATTIAALTLVFIFSGPPDGPRMSALAATFGFSPGAFFAPDGMRPASMLIRAPTLATYALIHVNWLHLLSNALMIGVFGLAVMLRLGSALRFFLLLAIASAGGALVFGVFHLKDGSVLVGASGAASGLIGAFIRFGFQRRAFALDGPAAAPLFERSTITWTLIIITLMVVIGRFEPSFGAALTRVAFEAHVGGFLAGVLAMSFLDARGRRRMLRMRTD